MRIAAFGDIHSNHIALEACLAEIERIGVDGVVFLGDYVSDCACPQKTLSLLKETAQKYPCWFIRGNREEYMIDNADGKKNWKDNSETGSFLYTYEQLTEEDLAWFRSLPITKKVEIEGAPAFEICHGSQWQSRCSLLPGRDEFDQVLEKMETELLLCAHTHEAFVAEKNGKTIANGGCVGLTCGGYNGASFAIIELMEGKWVPKLMRVGYDIEAVIREFHESGFMERGHLWAKAVAKSLRTGGNYTIEWIERSNRYAEEMGVPYATEETWQRAAKDLEI